MIDKRTSFTTSFGKTIEFVPGHIEFVEKTVGLVTDATEDLVHASGNYVGGHQNVDFEQANEKLKSKKKSLSLSGYATRLHRAYQFINLLRNTETKYPFKKGLDIGTGYGYQPRILKALGIVKEYAGLDIYDRASSVDESVLARQHKKFRKIGKLDSFQSKLEGSNHQRGNSLGNILRESVPNQRIKYRDGSGWMPDSGVFNLKFVNKPSLDSFVAGDIYQHNGKYDLVTAFHCLPWFDSKLIIPKISDLLDFGGIFYASLVNWWCALNPTNLAGHFPFACQRLNQEDYFRYLDECLPENAESMKVWYKFFDPSHPTLSDYIKLAHENGLILLDYKANNLPLPAETRRGLNSIGYLEHDYSKFHTVLDDIHQFRPDVRLEDLLPHTYGVVFRKIDKNNQLDMNRAQELIDNVHLSSGSSLATRASKKIAKFFFGPWR